MPRYNHNMSTLVTTLDFRLANVHDVEKLAPAARVRNLATGLIESGYPFFCYLLIDKDGILSTNKFLVNLYDVSFEQASNLSTDMMRGLERCVASQIRDRLIAGTIEPTDNLSESIDLHEYRYEPFVQAIYSERNME